MQSNGRGKDRVRLNADESATSGTEARPPRVLRAFAVSTAVAVLMAALVVVLFVRHNVESTSEQKVGDHASFVAKAVIPQILPASAWSQPLSGAELTKVNTEVNRLLMGKGGIRIKFYNRAGTVIYSTDNSLIGTKTDEPGELKEVLVDGTTTDITHVNAEGGDGKNTKAIEAYSPVTYSGKAAPTGIFEIYNDYGQVAGSIRSQALPMTIAVLLVLLLLYLALWPILRRTTRQLSYSNNELRRRAADLNENLMERAQIEDRLRETILDLEKSETALHHSQEETIMRLSLAVESRDAETGSHIERMGRYCALLAEKIGWSPERCELMRIASPLHDVGKIAIPDSVLQKPGALTPDERVAMEKHAEIGYKILAGSESPLLDLGARIALAHHEHWDGGGYPNGLKGEEIPVEGRIAAIADVFDALTSDRVYRKAMTVDKALSIMSEGRGQHFDPQILDTFFDSIVEVLMIRDGHNPAAQKPEPATHRRRRRRAGKPVAAPVGTIADDGDGRRSLVG
jgi:HD-GYP domain-containing protein (c-di-GMP phosphodiesterase class II)